MTKQIPVTIFRAALSVVFVITAVLSPVSAQTSGSGQIEVLNFIYRQDFSAKTADWNQEREYVDQSTINYSISEGVYQWEMAFTKDLLAFQILNADIEIPADVFLVSATIRIESDVPEADGGILYNIQDESHFYYARVSRNGFASALAFENGTWVPLTGDIQLFNFSPDETNRITVSKRGGVFDLLVNDFRVGSFSDDRYSGGAFGLAAGGSAGFHEVFVFDDIDIMEEGTFPSEASGASTEGAEDAPASGSEVRPVIPENELNGEPIRPGMKPVAVMNTIYPLTSEFANVNYAIRLKEDFSFYREGNASVFCLSAFEPGEACLAIYQYHGVWSDPESICMDIMRAFSEKVENFSILHSQSSRLDGYPAYTAITAFDLDGVSYQSVNTFTQIQQVFFQVMQYGRPEAREASADLLKEITESFWIEYY